MPERVSFDPPVSDADMPDGMLARPREGDVEEAFVDVLPDLDGDIMPDPMDDGAMLDDIQADAAAMARDLDRRAVAGQERADRDAASFIDEFDVSIDPQSTYTETR